MYCSCLFVIFKNEMSYIQKNPPNKMTLEYFTTDFRGG